MMVARYFLDSRLRGNDDVGLLLVSGGNFPSNDLIGGGNDGKVMSVRPSSPQKRGPRVINH
jgi:hypothetical protein